MALWGKVIDQANIIKSSFDDLEKAVIKATRLDMSVPKEKHIVLKTLIVFHRLFINGNQRFIEDLKWRGSIFPLGRFNDLTSPEAHVQSAFIRKYAQYLEEKVAVYRELKVEFEKDPDLCKGLPIEEAFARLPKLQRQLDALSNCQTSSEAITNVITALAFEQMIKDSFKLYRGLNDGIISVLETYFNLDRKAAAKALDIYKAFMRETSAIIAMYEMAKKRFNFKVPELKHAPTTLVTSLEDYVKDLEDGRTPEVRTLIESRHAEKSEAAPPHDNNERAKAEPRATLPPRDLLFDEPDISQAQAPAQVQTAPSLIDPFGVASPQPTGGFVAPPQPYSSPIQSYSPPVQAQPQSAVFDPFGTDTFAVVQAPSRPTQQSSPFNDPFNTSFNTSPTKPSNTNYNPFSGNQSYEEKAQHIKNAFTPALQPTAPNPFGPPTTTSNTSPAYPKPNYNVSVGGPPVVPQTMTMVPYGMQYPNAPVNGPPIYGVPQQLPRQPSQNQPFGMGMQPNRNNNPF